MGATYLGQQRYKSFTKTAYFEILMVFPNPCNQIMGYLKIHDLSSFPSYFINGNLGFLSFLMYCRGFQCFEGTHVI